ncbi:HAD family hydrolase [Candidatus Woesearchaeota archaeon]|nr:HAD family hydrolase [Candidatus Woesearchaeota archaeon]
MTIKGIIFDWIGTLYEKGRGPYFFSKRVLETLAKKYPLVLISKVNGNLDARRQQIEDSGLVSYFKEVIVTKDKTDDLYLSCISKLGISPRETVIVDDRPVRGIAVGNSIGCQTFWIQTGEWSFQVPDQETGEPTRRINSVEDLLEIL